MPGCFPPALPKRTDVERLHPVHPSFDFAQGELIAGLAGGDPVLNKQRHQ
jgi:hypothetical protein